MSVKSWNKTRETCNGHGHNDGHKRGLLDKRSERGGWVDVYWEGIPQGGTLEQMHSCQFCVLKLVAYVK